ncbi:hypothetical protein BGX38DRAFT_1216544 [Terfezia claveryi]|nr:hypothetical protein BGX38DRAFT_1216544 [Terfezia claveryi]
MPPPGRPTSASHDWHICSSTEYSTTSSHSLRIPPPPPNQPKAGIKVFINDKPPHTYPPPPKPWQHRRQRIPPPPVITLGQHRSTRTWLVPTIPPKDRSTHRKLPLVQRPQCQPSSHDNRVPGPVPPLTQFHRARLTTRISPLSFR